MRIDNDISTFLISDPSLFAYCLNNVKRQWVNINENIVHNMQHINRASLTERPENMEYIFSYFVSMFMTDQKRSRNVSFPKINANVVCACCNFVVVYCW